MSRDFVAQRTRREKTEADIASTDLAAGQDAAGGPGSSWVGTWGAIARFIRKLLGLATGFINVADYATPQAAYDAAGAGGTVFWPKTVSAYVVTSPVQIRNGNVTTVFGGAEINHAPTSAGALFDVATSSPATQQLNRPRFEGTAVIYSTDTTYSKVAFLLKNVSRPHFSPGIRICGPTKEGSTYQGSSGGDGGSVGIYALGREQYNFGSLAIEAQVPIRFGANPDGSHYDMDHIFVGQAFLNAGSTAPSTLPHTVIMIDGDVRISVCKIAGPVSLIGGASKLYWHPASPLAVSSSRLTLSGFLNESGTAPAGYEIDILIPDGGQVLDVLSIEDAIFDPSINGIYTKNVSHVRLRGVHATQTTGKKIIKCEGALLTLSWDGLVPNAVAPTSLVDIPADMVRSFSSQTIYGDSRALPSTAVYTKAYATGSAQRPFMGVGPNDIWTSTFLLAIGGSQNIPIASDLRSVTSCLMIICVNGSSATSQYAQGGVFGCAPNDCEGDSGGAHNKRGITKLSGTANIVAGTGGTAGQIGITGGTRLAGDVAVYNNSGEAVTVTIFAVMARSTAS